MNAWTERQRSWDLPRTLWTDEDQRLADRAMFNVTHELGDPTREAPTVPESDEPVAFE